MPAHQRPQDWRSGSITVAPFSSSISSGMLVYTWHPSAQIASGVPPGYCVSLQCSAVEGRRQFLLANDSPTNFVLNASQGGQIILALRDRLPETTVRMQDFYRLLYQRTWHTREFCDRRFAEYSDLFVKTRGRISSSESDVLPDEIGLDEHGKGKRWTIEDVIREGRDACREASNSHPDAAEIIRRGLKRAAQQNPLFACGVKEAQTLVRMAIFAVTNSLESVNSAQVDWVEEQVKAVFMEHVDDLGEQFDKILEDPKSDLVRRIAKRKKTPVGRLTREQVRAALATIGWRAVSSLGDCVDAQMRAFQASLSEPLNRWEKSQFDVAFLRQPYFGNLPLLLLKDRINFLKYAVLDIFEKPGNRRRVAVFHRMLAFYDEMLGKRRAADRRYQQRRLAKNEDGTIADQAHLSNLPVVPCANVLQKNASNFKEIVKFVLVKGHFACEEDFSGDWDVELIAGDEAVVQILVSADNHRIARPYKIMRSVFEQFATEWKVLNEPTS